MAYRIGGLALALGIGSAVVAGHGVASADSSGGSTNPSSTGAASTGSDGSAASASASATKDDPSTKPAGDATKAAESETSTASEDADAAGDQSDVTPAKKKGSKDSHPANAASDPVTKPTRAANDSIDGDAKRAKPVSVEASDKHSVITDDTRAPAADVSAVRLSAVKTPEPQQVSIPAKPQDPIETASVALSSMVSALFDFSSGDAPTAPIASPVMWTLAAASRRELSAATPDAKQVASPVTNSLTTEAPLVAADAPAVVAIPQTAPLAWLQQIPVFGPTIVTPIVTVLHLIPIVSDVIHPYVGFPVQAGSGPASRDVKVISPDGTAIYVHFMPASGLQAGQKAPTVLNGPGLGLPGATNIDGNILDDITVDNFGLLSVSTLRQAGYNVVTWDPRGEWNSGGQLELNSADFEGQDMSAIISWIATQPEVRLDGPGDPRLGMVGVSYGGGIQLVTAAKDKRVDAIVPAITYNAFDSSLDKNGAFKSSWAALLVAALNLTGAHINPRIEPAAINGALTGAMSPSDLQLLLDRNPDIGKITVPTLLINGTVDTIFSLQEADTTAQTLLANGVTTKVLWFCGGHGFCANNPIDLRDGALIKLRTMEWLDHYVKGDMSVPTGPQFEWVDQRGQWYSSSKYPVKPGSTIVTSSSGESTLPLVPYVGGSGVAFVPFALVAPVAVNLKVPAATSTTYLVGAPKLTLTYSGTGSNDHVWAQLVDNSTGLVLGNQVTSIPVTLDGNTHTITLPLEPVSHTLRPGESVTLQLVGEAGIYARITPDLGSLNVASMQLTLPTADPASVTPESVP